MERRRDPGEPASDERDDLGGRPGLALWGPVGRWVFLNWPRGSWQYDLICAAIIAALFVLPGPQPRAASPSDVPRGPHLVRLAWTRPASPVQLDADEVLRQMERAGRDLESFRAGFTSIKRYALFDDREVESGTLLFLQPSHVKRLVEEPQQRIEVVSAGQAKVYVPRIKQVQLYSFDDGSAEQPRFALPGISDPEELREQYDVVLEGVDEDARIGALPEGSNGDDVRYYVLKLTPLPGSEAAGHWRTLRLWVPEGSWLPAHRIELVEHTADTTRIDLYDIVRNPELSRSDFELDLPADVEVVEHE